MDTVGSLGLDAETPDQQRRFAEQLIAWSTEQHPADAADVTPATLLAEAGQIFEILGDHAAALETFRRAATAEGVVEPDVRCFLHRAFMSVGDVPAARLLAEQVRRSGSAEPDAYVMIGETYERAGELREAHHWVNLGLQRLGRRLADDDGTRRGIELLLLAIVRRRIRRALDQPADGIDRLAARALSGRRANAG